MSSDSFSRWALAMLVASILPVASISQTFYGSIVGTVTDSSGAVVQGATVTLTNTGTGERRTAPAGAEGLYRFVNLMPGVYKLEVEHKGFKRYMRDQIQVNVQAAVRADVALQVGEVTQSLEIVAEAPLLQTEDASIGQIVAARTVEELPLNGRNVLNLVATVPGVVPQGGTSGNLTGQNVFAGGNYQIGGGTANQGTMLYDGIPVITAYGNITMLIPNQDAVGEFRVQTNNNTAEFGRYLGGVINMTSKSGTNEFHGTVYEFLRNTKLNANEWFSNATGAGKAPFNQNQFGANVAGPIKKDKTFFYGGYEGFRQRIGKNFIATVPLEAMYNGDFSNYRNDRGTQIPIYDPLTQCNTGNNPACGNSGGATRTPFADNMIPANRFDPVSRKLAAFSIFARPTSSGSPYTHNYNYSSNVAEGGGNDQVNFRIDQNLSDKHRILSRYTRWNSANLGVSPYHNGLTMNEWPPEAFTTTQIMVADTYSLSPSTILDVRVGYMRWYYTRTPGTLGLDLAQTFGFPSYMSNESLARLDGFSPNSVVPNFSFSGPNYNQYNTGNALGRDNNFSLAPSVIKIKGSHTMKFGADLRRLETSYAQYLYPGGTYSFSTSFTSSNPVTDQSTGNSFASFLLGFGGSGSRQASQMPLQAARYQGYYATDTFQVTKRLTLTMGLRWEIPGVPYERYDRMATFNATELNPLLKAISIPAVTVGGGTVAGSRPIYGALDLVNTSAHPERGLRPEEFRLLAPRVGIAYRLSNRTVIRTGAGVFYAPQGNNFRDGAEGNVVNTLNNTWVTQSADFLPVTPLSNPFPSGLRTAPGRESPRYQVEAFGTVHGEGSLGDSLRDEKFPYSYQWNFTLQHQFRGDVAAEAAYVGLRGLRLPQGSYQMNQLDPKYLTLQNALATQAPNPFYGQPGTGISGQLPYTSVSSLLKPFPQFGQGLLNPGAMIGDSSYHSLQLKTEKRLSSGGTLLAAYTFSKIIANVESLSYWLDPNMWNSSLPQNVRNMREQKALSAYDARQRLVLSYVLDLPFGKGKTFLAGAQGVTGKLVSGWSVNGISTFQLGMPLHFTASHNLWGYGYSTVYPNVVAGCQKTVSGSAQSRLGNWFNTACFSVPPNFTLGNEARNDPELRTQGINNFDFGLSKRTAISERFGLEFRAEAFNVFNRVQFGYPNLQIATWATGFGQVTSTAASYNPRLIQLALRLRY